MENYPYQIIPFFWLLCYSLQKVLGIENLEEIMESHLVSATNIMHNCLYINKSGVVTNIDPKGRIILWTFFKFNK